MTDEYIMYLIIGSVTLVAVILSVYALYMEKSNKQAQKSITT
jgi:hypothetical protein